MSWPGGNQQDGQWGPPGGYGGTPPGYGGTPPGYGGQPPGYGGAPPGYGGGPYQPPSDPGRPPGGISPIMMAVLAIVLVAVLIIAVAVVVVSLREDGSQAGAEQSPTASEETETQEQEPEPSETEQSAAPDEPLIQDGWQQVRSRKYGLIYEVPQDSGWVVDSSGTMRGWEDDETGDVTSMSGTAGYRDSYKCKHRSLAELGTRGITDSTDTKSMSENVGHDWALASYTTKSGEPVLNTRSVKKFDANGLKGHHAVVDVKVNIEEADCDPATARVHAVAVPDGDGSRILIIDAHTGVKGALSGKTVNTVISTLHDVDYEVKD